MPPLVTSVFVADPTMLFSFLPTLVGHGQPFAHIHVFTCPWHWNEQRLSIQSSVHISGFQGRSSSARRPAPQLQRSPSEDGGRNFVQENKMGAVAPVRAPVRHATDDDGSKYLAKRDYGRVPAYLVERKMEMAADYEASIRAKEAALIPPGELSRNVFV